MNDLPDRLLNFSVDVILFLRNYRDSQENRIIKNQLIKSATSVGANYEESQAASSKADFINKVNISLKEIRETSYWLKILYRIRNNDELTAELMILIDESEQLMKILGSIAKNASDKG